MTNYNKAIGIDLAVALPVWGCDICAVHEMVCEKYGMYAFVQEGKSHDIGLTRCVQRDHVEIYKESQSD